MRLHVRLNYVRKCVHHSEHPYVNSILALSVLLLLLCQQFVRSIVDKGTFEQYPGSLAVYASKLQDPTVQCCQRFESQFTRLREIYGINQTICQVLDQGECHNSIADLQVTFVAFNTTFVLPLRIEEYNLQTLDTVIEIVGEFDEVYSNTKYL
uniref:Uncharacterized protein n=1 Tax=Lygus hesperus TaxID=30085 RepID=A0A0A9WNT6_LYGHE